MKLLKSLLVLGTLCSAGNSEGMLSASINKSGCLGVRNFSVSSTTVVNSLLTGLGVGIFESSYRRAVNNAETTKKVLDMRLNATTWRRAAKQAGVLQPLIKNKERLPLDLTRMRILSSPATIIGGIYGGMITLAFPIDDEYYWGFIPLGIVAGAGWVLADYESVTDDVNKDMDDADIKRKYIK